MAVIIIFLLFLSGLISYCIYAAVILLLSRDHGFQTAGLICLWIIFAFIWAAYAITINIYSESKLEVVETDEWYEVVQVIQNSKQETVYGINEDGKIITGPIYDICYDKNAEIMYAVEVSERYRIPDIAKKLGLVEEKENYFRIYTNNRSYVDEQSIYYKMDRNENM
jgi:hypothetical protein